MDQDIQPTPNPNPEPTPSQSPQSTPPSQTPQPPASTPAKGYGGKSKWVWILLYVLIGGVLYALFWYFFLRDSGSSGLY